MSAPASSKGGPVAQGQQVRKWWTLAAMCFGLFMALLDVTIVNVALPTIARKLPATTTDLQWVVNSYVIALAVFIVTAGRLGDIFGRKRLFVIGLAVFTFGSLLCGLSGNISVGSLSHATVLHISRAIQGTGGAFIFPLSLAIISVTFQGKDRGAALGLWGAIGGLATAIGPLVGGVLVQSVGWQSIFYVNLPIGALGIGVVLWAVQESRDERATRTVDIFGLLTISVSVFCLILALIEGNDKGWSSALILSLFAVAAVTLTAFVLGELRLSSPMVDPRLFLVPSFTGAAIAGFALSAGMFSLFFFLALYLQDTLRFGALDAGVRFLPLSLIMFFVSPIAGRFTDRFGARPVMTAGLVTLTGAVLLLARVSPSDGPDDWTVLLPGLIAGGIGMGLTLPPLATVAVSTVGRARAGMASGANTMCRQIGNAFGIAFLGAIFTHQVKSYTQQQIQASQFPSGLEYLKNQLAQRAAAGGLDATGGPPAGVSSDPTIGRIVTHAVNTGFVNGLVDIFHVAAAILAVGALCGYLLIKRADMQFEQVPGVAAEPKAIPGVAARVVGGSG